MCTYFHTSRMFIASYFPKFISDQKYSNTKRNLTRFLSTGIHRMSLTMKKMIILIYLLLKYKHC